MARDGYLHLRRLGEEGGPLLFLLHGTGGDENQLAELAQELLPRATVIAPRGDVSEAGAFRFFRRHSEGVYDMEDLKRATHKMAAFMAAHREAEQPSFVAALGYSNGANILASVLFHSPPLIDAAALLHPLIPFQPRIAGTIAGKPVLVSAGRRDPICPPELTRRLESWLREAGADVSMVWHEGGHELRSDEILAARALFATLAETRAGKDG
jgi:phospholipase/carboxylesterase